MTLIATHATSLDQARRNHPSYRGGNYVSGKTDKAKGKIKKAIGDLTGNKRLRREGKIDEVAGQAKEVIDNVKDRISPVRGTE